MNINIHKYSLALVTTFESKKNSSAVAREIGVHQSTTSRFLDKINLDDIKLEPMVKCLFGNKKLTFIIDESVLIRLYSESTEGISSMVDHSTKSFANGCKIVLGGLTDGSFFLPIYVEQWIAQFILGNAYQKMIDIAKKLILKVMSLNLNIEAVVMDGLYFSKEFLHWLYEKKINFVIKAKTTTSVYFKGNKMQLKNCSALRLNSNQNAKTIAADWDGKQWNFTAVRRNGKRGPKTIYLISNFVAKSKKYAKIYNSRWTIEKCFRSAKQSFGLKSSCSQFAHIYLNHIKCVFYAYALMQFVMKKFKLKSTEEAIRKTQALKKRYGFKETAAKISFVENYA